MIKDASSKLFLFWICCFRKRRLSYPWLLVGYYIQYYMSFCLAVAPTILDLSELLNLHTYNLDNLHVHCLIVVFYVR